MKNPKRKGSNGEREALALLQAHGVPAIRNQQGRLAGFRSGYLNPDIGFSLAGRSWHGEIKRVERLNVHAAMNQAIHDAGGAATPVVIHRRNREEWLCTLRLDDLLDALQGRD